MDKNRIREAHLIRRRRLPVDRVRAWSATIHRHLLGLPPMKPARTVLTYIASRDNEVETLPAIDSLIASGVTVFAPRPEPDGRLTWIRVKSTQALAPGRFGILEPTGDERCADGDGDVVLVPGIAFDRTGQRVGYGSGYFDRFLQSFEGVKIGLAFASQIVDEVPFDEHDVAMDWVVSEFGAMARQVY